MVRVNILWCTLATWAWFVVMKVRGFVEEYVTIDKVKGEFRKVQKIIAQI